MFDLSTKTIVVTGAGGTIGRAYVHGLLVSGANVIALDLKNLDSIFDVISNEYEIEASYKKNLLTYSLDITKPDEVVGFSKEFKNFFDDQGLYGLVNNASLIKVVGVDALEDAYSKFSQQTPKDWMPYLDVDISGSLNMVQACVPFMKKDKSGSIVNISSTYGLVAPDNSLYNTLDKNKSHSNHNTDRYNYEKPIGYSISKAAVLNMTRHLASLYSSEGIRVNTLTPGGVYSGNPEKFVKAYCEKTPLGRMARPSDYVGPLIFMLSAASSYMTGSNLVVDGGWTAW